MTASNLCEILTIFLYYTCTRGWYIRINICAGSINKWTVIYSLVAVTQVTCYLHCISTGNLE